MVVHGVLAKEFRWSLPAASLANFSSKAFMARALYIGRQYKHQLRGRRSFQKLRKMAMYFRLSVTGSFVCVKVCVNLRNKQS
jgi:hypothetical protein